MCVVRIFALALLCEGRTSSPSGVTDFLKKYGKTACWLFRLDVVQRDLDGHGLADGVYVQHEFSGAFHGAHMPCQACEGAGDDADLFAWLREVHEL